MTQLDLQQQLEQACNTANKYANAFAESEVKLAQAEAERDALQQQVNALAAEVECIREQSEVVYAAGYCDGHLNTVDGIAYAPGIKDDFYHRALQVMAEVETPATDTIKRQWMAEGLEWMSKKAGPEFPKTQVMCEHFAAQLRQPEEKGQ